MLQVRLLRKSFGHVQALKGVSFDAPDRAITGLLGANGAGKTTTLRIIAGVLTPDAGTIRLGGSCMREDPIGTRRRLGALLDHQGVYPRLTGREHLAYFGRLRGLPSAVLDEHVEHVLATFGLRAVADRPVGGYSQGERMKVSLGCAMIHQPSHLLLDEPTNGLDVPAVRTLRLLLKELRERGTCIVFSTHVLAEVEELSDRVVILAAGTPAAEGSLDEVRKRTDGETLEDAFVTLTDRGDASSCQVNH
jgi:sodium transport system ATP-binding protein